MRQDDRDYDILALYRVEEFYESLGVPVLFGLAALASDFQVVRNLPPAPPVHLLWPLGVVSEPT